MKAVLKSLLLLPALFFVTSTASAETEEDECGKFAYSASLKRAHIYEKIPAKAYFGYVTAKGGYRNGYRLAFCEIKNGRPELNYLHFTKADGTKGGEISVTNDGALDWSLSMCGTHETNVLIGGYGYQIEEAEYYCEEQANYFGQVTLLPDRWLTIFTLGGDDVVKGVVNQVHDGESHLLPVLIKGGSGDDILDADGGYYSHFNPTVPNSIPAFADIQGESGHDDIWSNGNWSFGLIPGDKCKGGTGDDWLRCYRPNSSCNGTQGRDLCDCENESLCEINP